MQVPIGNSSLGTGVVGGMVVGTLALLFVVPVFYIIFEFLQEKIRPPMEEEADVQVLLEPVEEDMAAASILISVPKKRFKRAVKRNLVKRQVREKDGDWKNKHLLLGCAGFPEQKTDYRLYMAG